jgi:hypothetical protein
MKRLLVISLIFVHLLNVIGYAIIARIEHTNNAEMDFALDQDEFSGSEAITLRIPATMPYPVVQHNSYERVQGTFNFEGNVYRLVRRKHYNDTLYVVCVKDKKSTIIASTINELTASFAGIPLPEKSNAKIASLLIKDFSIEQSLIHKCPRVLLEILLHSDNESSSEWGYIASIDQPPQGRAITSV